MVATASDVTASDARDDEALRCVRTQALMREINEQFHLLLVRAGHERCELVCECARGDCLRPILAATADYESVRRFPSRFIISPGHEDLDFERVVEHDCGAYVVVEKIGAGASAAVQLDPRRDKGNRSNARAD